MRKPLIAITTGDPSGIGPEVIASLWTDEAFHSACRAVVFGHPGVMQSACEKVGSFTRVIDVAVPDDLDGDSLCMPVMACGPPDADRIPLGVVDPRGGQAAYEALSVATEMALAGRVDAITTAPLNKEALAAAGHDFPGHTEMLAHFCGVREVGMMLYLPPADGCGGPGGPGGLGVVHVTLHMALAKVFRALSASAIVAKVKLADAVFRCLLNDDDTQPRSLRLPRIGVCALNPHGGENGLFGDEEERIIGPAVQMARQEGFQLTGPLPADTLMMRAAEGEFDAVVAMYHDQGHIALKLLGMHRAVNITLGLPIIRTSVAHGTAFDLAGKGKASHGSLLEAIRVAVQLVRRRADLTISTSMPV